MTASSEGALRVQSAAPLPDSAHEAIEVLYAQEAASVYRTICAIVLDRAQAQDLTQETFVRAFKAWDGFDRSNPRAWLLRIATNLAITHYRTEKRRRRVPPWMLLQRSHDRGPEASEDRDLVSWLMRPLSPDQRALITLHYYQQVPRAEIAELLGIPVGTVASRINKAMQVLRQRAGAWDAAPFLQGGTR
ncbi:MAG: RNA polymerase sigma factor [Candidatus Dormibacteraeota bacterium]|nr:RNA polymerase sigma factor [Candidatus Dormibacteraeota bacterium]